MYLIEIALFILKIIMDIKCIVRDFLELTSILNNNKNRRKKYWSTSCDDRKFIQTKQFEYITTYIGLTFPKVCLFKLLSILRSR